MKADAVVTRTACENNKTCQKFLQNLHEAYRPQHIIQDLNDLITIDAQHELDSAYNAVWTEYEWTIRSCACFFLLHFVGCARKLGRKKIPLISSPPCFI